MVGDIIALLFLNPTVEDITLIPLLSWPSNPTKSCLKQHNYRKILKISAGLIYFFFGGDYTWWEICVKIYWVSL